MAARPPKLLLLIVFTIVIMLRAMRFRGTSSANLFQSCRLSGTWQKTQLRPTDAEKKPIVLMNSLTGIPFSTWTLVNTCSAIGCFSTGADWAASAGTNTDAERISIKALNGLLNDSVRSCKQTQYRIVTN